MRDVIEVNVIRRQDSGEWISNYRTHVITLANLEAVQRVVESIEEGTAGRDSDLSVDDVLEYDDDLDA